MHLRVCPPHSFPPRGRQRGASFRSCLRFPPPSRKFFSFFPRCATARGEREGDGCSSPPPDLPTRKETDSLLIHGPQGDGRGMLRNRATFPPLTFPPPLFSPTRCEIRGKEEEMREENDLFFPVSFFFCISFPPRPSDGEGWKAPPRGPPPLFFLSLY